ncbi:MAG: glycosyltransferase [Pirellulaceae bacterium]
MLYANKMLPAQDYRVNYALNCSWIGVHIAMPGKTEQLPDDRYVQFRVGEGICVSDVSEFARLFTFLLRRRRNIAINHFFSTKFVLFGPILSRMAGIASVVTITGFGRVFNASGPGYRAFRALYFAVLFCSLRFARLVLFQNRGDMAYLAGRFPSYASRFRYIGSAVDVRPLFKETYGQAVLTVVCVARLHWSKGVHDFLDVAERLRGPRYDFVVVGPKSKGDEYLYERVTTLHQKGVIRYAGELGEDDLRTVYEKAHVLLFLSYGEGMPRVMIEAGLAGVCPVAYDINANRDLVPDARHGYLIRRGDIAAAAEAITQLYDDRSLLRSKAKAFQEHAIENFSMEAYRRNMDDCLISVISS